MHNHTTTATGVSAREQYDINSLAVPRKAQEAIGGIALLRNPDTGASMTVNVEYNQLDPLLRATVNAEGDVNDETGFSPFPGVLGWCWNMCSLSLAQKHTHLSLPCHPPSPLTPPHPTPTPHTQATSTSWWSNSTAMSHNFTPLEVTLVNLSTPNTPTTHAPRSRAVLGWNV